MRSRNNLGGRRRVLAWLSGLIAARGGAAPLAAPPSTTAPFARVVPGYELRFPQDEGSHPEFRVEWWYITGWLDGDAPAVGFQVTFFRVRPALRHDNPSAFTPRQLIIAHAALASPRHGRLIHDQRAARAGFGLAGAAVGRADISLDDWHLRQGGRAYRTLITAREFALELAFTPTQPPMKQGDAGYSRKGPAKASASYYYSLPHLDTRGTVTLGGKRTEVRGTAWFDHEWSSQYLEPDAEGWDWIGINLADGGALMAFRIRDRRGAALWTSATLRAPDGGQTSFGKDEVRFVAQRRWTSARTGISYPVALTVGIGKREFTVEPLFDDQEHDTRMTTGTIYWEGAVRLLQDGRLAGRGYLELTGYGKPLLV